MEGRRVEAKAESLLALLRGLGAPVEGPGDLAGAIEVRRRELWNWQIEPVIVAWEGRFAGFDLRLPEREATGKVAFRMEVDDGLSDHSTVEQGNLAIWQSGNSGARWESSLESLVVRERRRVAGETYLRLTVPVDAALPLGYHRLVVEAAGHRLESVVIAAPRRSFNPPAGKRWGAFLPLYALPTTEGRAVADFSDLGRLVDWAADKGASQVGTLPLLASFLDEPFDPSPYAPVSRLFWNELYVATKAGGGQGEVAPEPLVEYRPAMAAKRAALAAEARSLSEEDGRAFEAYRRARPEVEDYGRFRAAIERIGTDWRRWPERQRGGELGADDYDAETARYYEYAQWRADEQMRTRAAESKGKGCGLYLDLPVGVHALGYDAWRFRSLFGEGMSVGAPPDVVTTSGQDWGFAPLAPAMLRRTGYKYVIDYLRHHLAVAGRLRIDHAMGLHRLYCIPKGGSAADGAYLRYKPEDMYAILCLESQRYGAAIAGEDLGIVPGPVNRGLRQRAMPGMYVLAIEMRAEGEPPFRPIARRKVASLSTHDLPPFAAFWRMSDMEMRVELGVLNKERAVRERPERMAQQEAMLSYLKHRGLLADESLETVLRGCLTLLAESRAEDMMVSLEDLWLEEAPQNVPGTLDEYPNWRRRARYSLEEIEALEAVQAALAVVQRLRPKRSIQDKDGGDVLRQAQVLREPQDERN